MNTPRKSKSRSNVRRPSSPENNDHPLSAEDSEAQPSLTTNISDAEMAVPGCAQSSYDLCIPVDEEESDLLLSDREPELEALVPICILEVSESEDGQDLVDMENTDNASSVSDEEFELSPTQVEQPPHEHDGAQRDYAEPINLSNVENASIHNVRKSCSSLLESCRGEKNKNLSTVIITVKPAIKLTLEFPHIILQNTDIRDTDPEMITSWRRALLSMENSSNN